MNRELFTSREIASGYANLAFETSPLNKALILVGPNGVGKGTISKLLIGDHSLKLARGVRYTSRPRSELEMDGVDYNFVSTHFDFKRLVETAKLIEYSSHPQGYYGTGRDLMESVWVGEQNILVDVEAKAALVLKGIFTRIGVPYIDVLLSPVSRTRLEDIELVSQVLRQRMLLRDRGETETELVNRLSYALDTYSSADKFGFVIANEEGKTDHAAGEIKKLLTSAQTSSN